MQQHDLRTSGADPAGGATPAPSTALPPILVADDDPVAALVIRRSLEARGVANPIETAAHGDDAVEQLRAMAAEGRIPVLVLLDGDMPHRSGADVLRWMKQHPALARVPAIMLSGSGAFDDITDAYGLGAASYLVKPVGFDALGDVLQRLGLRSALLPAIGSDV